MYVNKLLTLKVTNCLHAESVQNDASELKLREIMFTITGMFIQPVAKGTYLTGCHRSSANNSVSSTHAQNVVARSFTRQIPIRSAALELSRYMSHVSL